MRKRKEDTIRYDCQYRKTSGGAAARSFTATQEDDLQISLNNTDGKMWRLRSVWDIPYFL